MATGLTLKTSCIWGIAGFLASPLRRMALAGASSAKSPTACLVNSFTTSAVRVASGLPSVGEALDMGTPVFCGSVSETASLRPAPRRTTAAR